MAQLLERSELDRGQRSQVNVLLEAGRGLKTLLDDVIALSRDEGKANNEEDNDCDPAQAARTVARVLQPRAWEKQLKLSVSAGTDLPRVAADPRRVRQVLLKLADNALKFTQRGCVELRVETYREGDVLSLRFSVSDTGLGIAEEKLDNLFEPFSTIDNSYTRRQEGAGLGLAVAKRIVEQVGGAIGFESEAGQGSTFWFTVPATGASVVRPLDTIAIAADAPPPWGLSASSVVRGPAHCARRSGTCCGAVRQPPRLCRKSLRCGRAGRTRMLRRYHCGRERCGFASSRRRACGYRSWRSFRAACDCRRRSQKSCAGRPGPVRCSFTADCAIFLGRGDADAGARLSLPEHAVAAIDAPAFAALEKSLGLQTLLEILHAYIATSETLCAGLSEASDEKVWEDATRIAQDIAGAAGGLGLAALMAWPRAAFAQKVRDGDGDGELKGAAQAIVVEHNRVRRALANALPGTGGVVAPLSRIHRDFFSPLTYARAILRRRRMP